jgi:hypothetical protein
VARTQLGIPTTTRDRRLDAALALAPSSGKFKTDPRFNRWLVAALSAKQHSGPKR